MSESTRCNRVIDDGRHVCRHPAGHDGECYPHINASDPRPSAVSAPAGEATVDRAKAARCPACGVACFVDVGGALCDYHTALFHACAIQEDIAAILRALGLSDHARPVSAHAVVRDEILPAIAALRQGLHA